MADERDGSILLTDVDAPAQPLPQPVDTSAPKPFDYQLTKRWCVEVRAATPWRADIVQETNTSNYWPRIVSDLPFEEALWIVERHNDSVGASNQGVVLGTPGEFRMATLDTMQKIADELADHRAGRFEREMAGKTGLQAAMFLARLTPLLVGRAHSIMTEALIDMMEDVD